MGEPNAYSIALESPVTVRARCLAERIETKALESSGPLALTPLVLRTGRSGCAVVFRYGTVVLFDVSSAEEAALLTNLQPFLNDALSPELQDSLSVVRSTGRETMNGDRLELACLDLARIQLLAEILARNVVLERSEARIREQFDRLDPLARNLAQKGLWGASTRRLIRHIGEVLIGLQNMVARVEVSEKPEVLWENPELERLYAHLEDEYEIRERHRAVERKLELISTTAETILDILQTKRGLRVEWLIVILILVEILITLYELFLYPGH